MSVRITALAGLAMVLVGTAACEKIVFSEPSYEQRTAALEKKTLEDAKTLCTAGDCAAAHEKLGGIGSDSPVRYSGDFKDIENQWAKGQLAKAEQEKDREKKRKLLQEVARTTTVDASYRASASDKLAIVDPPATVTPPPPPSPAEIESQRVMEDVNALLRKNDRAGARKLLEPRVLAGKGSLNEIDMLAVLCTLKGRDEACLQAIKGANPDFQIPLPAKPGAR